MTEASPWHPHATWKGFTPNPDGSLAVLDANAVRRTLDELASLSMGTLRVVGAERGDDRAVLSLLRAAVQAGLEIEVELEALDEVLRAKFDAFEDAGVARLSVPVEGPDRRTHDPYRGLSGEFERTVRFLETVRASKTELELRTTLHAGVVRQITAMALAVEGWSASRWLVKVPVNGIQTGSSAANSPMAPVAHVDSIEQALTELAARTADAPYTVVTHHAPFFLRLCDRPSARPCMTHDERNGLCILPSGAITPDPAIPVAVGDVRRDAVGAVFDDHPLLRALRDPDAVEGKCGTCKFRTICGGSRARALAETGNLFASDPACTYDARPRSPVARTR